MGVLIDTLIDWQLLHMDGTNDQAKAFMQDTITPSSE